MNDSHDVSVEEDSSELELNEFEILKYEASIMVRRRLDTGRITVKTEGWVSPDQVAHLLKKLKTKS